MGRRLGALGLVVIALLGCSALAFGKARPLTKAQKRGCLGMTRQVNHLAKVAPADPAVLRAFGAFSATANESVRLTGMSVLGNLGVARYDPAHAVDLADPLTGWQLVLLPVHMAAPERSPRYCDRIPGWREAHRLPSGAGPGVCLLALIPRSDLQGALCESVRVLNSYLGALNFVEYGFDPRAVTLEPDGVSAVRYRFRNGKTTTVKVRHNLAVTPVFALPGYGAPIPDRFRLRVFRRWFPRTYPVKITLAGQSGAPIAARRRPGSLFNELAAANRLQLDIWNLTPPSQRPN